MTPLGVGTGHEHQLLGTDEGLVQGERGVTRHGLVIVGIQHQYRPVPYLRGVHRGVGDLQDRPSITVERTESVGIRHPGRTGYDDRGSPDAVVAGNQWYSEKAAH